MRLRQADRAGKGILGRGNMRAIIMVAWNDMKNSERYKSKILLEHKDQGTE